MHRYRSSGGDAMTFDDWMRARNPKYCPTDDTVALRELRDCWITAEHHSARAQEREQIIELMRDKCRKVGAGDTAVQGDMLLPANVQIESTPLAAVGSNAGLGSDAGKGE
jgi:hypothetical protein